MTDCVPRPRILDPLEPLAGDVKSLESNLTSTVLFPGTNHMIVHVLLCFCFFGGYCIVMVCSWICIVCIRIHPNIHIIH